MRKKELDSRYHVPNLERALRIFELLSQNPQGLSITEISNKLNFPRNSVFRIVSTLKSSEYLIKDEENKAYYLSRKLLSLGLTVSGDPSLVEVSLQEMHNLVNKYRETVPLGIIKDGKGIVLWAVAGKHHFRYVLEPGKLFNIHTSAAGKAIMAYLPEIERDKKISFIKFQKFNKRTIISQKKFIKELGNIKKRGYSVDHAEEIEGMHCVGAPIFNSHGYPVAAIWISGPSFRIREEHFDSMGKDVRSHADRISKQLGFAGNYLN